jgi:hypothetical protein
MGDVCKYGDRSVSSRTNTPEFDEGYEAAFGPSSDEIRTPKRAVYVYRGGRLVERGGEDDTGCYDSADEARLHIVSDLYMVGQTVPGPDGPIDIGSRKKRREHMRSESPVTGEPRELADMSDYKETWAAGEKRQKAILDGSYGREQRREVIGRRLYEAQMKDRNRR